MTGRVLLLQLPTLIGLLGAGMLRAGAHTSRAGGGARKLTVMSSEPLRDAVHAGAAVDPAAAPIPPALEPDAHDPYRAAARWTGIRLREAVHDGAVVVAAYHEGYLDGLRDAAARVAVAAADEPTAAETFDAADPSEAAGAAGEGAAVPPATDALVERARGEGYADGLRWREPARRGGLVRLMLFLTGKSARRFAAEDLMRSPRRVRRMIAYNDVVEDVIRDELLRRLQGTPTAT